VTKQLHDLFQIAAKQLGYDTPQDDEKYPAVAFRESYSGRGMFGKHTHAMTVPDLTYVFAMCVVIGSLDKNIIKDTPNYIAEEMQRLGSDRMGDGLIVY
jgi:hypothetical protein